MTLFNKQQLESLTRFFLNLPKKVITSGSQINTLFYLKGNYFKQFFH